MSIPSLCFQTNFDLNLGYNLIIKNTQSQEGLTFRQTVYRKTVKTYSMKIKNHHMLCLTIPLTAQHTVTFQVDYRVAQETPSDDVTLPPMSPSYMSEASDVFASSYLSHPQVWLCVIHVTIICQKKTYWQKKNLGSMKY